MKVFNHRGLAVAALVCLGAGGAQAQSASVYGLLDISAGRTQAPGGASSTKVDSGKMTTSHLGIKGDEDLGAGLKVVYSLEGFMRVDTGASGRFDGDAFWARNAFVGLSNPAVGSLTAGRITTSLFVQTLSFNPFGDAFGYSPSIRHLFTSGTVTGDTGWSQSIRYASPRWANVSFTLHSALGQGSGDRNLGASASYADGPLSAGLAWQKVQMGATINDTTTWQLAGAYDFGVVKAFGQFTRVDNDSTGRTYDITGLGASVPVGPGRVLAQWGQLEPDVGAKRRTMSLGYDHFLSKRTDVYAVYMNDKLTGTGTGNNYSVGIRHRF